MKSSGAESGPAAKHDCGSYSKRIESERTVLAQVYTSRGADQKYPATTHKTENAMHLECA